MNGELVASVASEIENVVCGENCRETVLIPIEKELSAIFRDTMLHVKGSRLIQYILIYREQEGSRVKMC